MRNSGFALVPWEVEAFEMLDDLFFAAQAEETRERAKAGGKG